VTAACAALRASACKALQTVQMRWTSIPSSYRIVGKQFRHRRVRGGVATRLRTTVQRDREQQTKLGEGVWRLVLPTIGRAAELEIKHNFFCPAPESVTDLRRLPPPRSQL
jgi:hypothetical protein